MDRDERQRIASQTNSLIGLQILVSIGGLLGVIAGLAAGTWILLYLDTAKGLLALVVLPLIGAYVGRRLGLAIWSS